MKLSISFLKSIYSLEETISKINNLNYDGYIHVDILDGKYVPSSVTDLDKYISVLTNTTKPLDVHLMVDHPISYINRLLSLKPEIITVHPDSLDDLVEISNILRNNNIKMGIALNPDDDINIIEKYADMIDLVLIMSVYPGKGGQSFIDSTPYKLEHLNKLKEVLNKNFLIEVDGGINDKTLPLIKNYISMYVCGSYICCNDDYQTQIDKLI